MIKQRQGAYHFAVCKGFMAKGLSAKTEEKAKNLRA